jgi:hypothetical protein
VVTVRGEEPPVAWQPAVTVVVGDGARSSGDEDGATLLEEVRRQDRERAERILAGKIS